MAIGSGNRASFNNGGYSNSSSSSENNSNRLYETQYYSRFKIKKDNLSLGVSFRSGLMVVDISEQKDSNTYSFESLATIFLSPTKAGLLANELRAFLHYYESGNIINGKAFGVNAGLGEKTSYIGIHANTNKDILITIGKVDSKGVISERATMSLNREYHFGLEWNDIDAMDVSKVYYDDIEIKQLLAILDDFSRSMNGALAYSVADLTRYDNAKVLKKLDPIYDKLGIERKNFGTSVNKNGGGFFSNNNASSSSNRITLEDIEEGLMGEED